jgi:hypothetical protein
MALVLADRVQEYSTTTGTGTLTLSGAYAGFQTFAAGIGNGNTCYYTITSDTNQWEVGIGTVGVGTLARTTLISSSTGSLVSFVGTLTVFVTYPAEKAIYQDASGNTLVPNLGSTTASAGSFTTLNSSGATRLGGASGNQSLQVNNVASAVNYAQIVGAVTGGAPTISAQGTDANIALGIFQKGTGELYLGGSATYPSLRVSTPVNTVNSFQIYGNATGGAVSLNALGLDANISMSIGSKGTGVISLYSNASETFRFSNVNGSDFTNYYTTSGQLTYIASGSSTNTSFKFEAKGTGSIQLASGGGTQTVVSNTASAVNYLQLTGATTGAAPTISAQGSDANINLVLQGKGTGVVALGGSTAANSSLQVAPTASSVNFAQIKGGQLNVGPQFLAQGTDTNIDLLFSTKGTGSYYFNTGGGTQISIGNAASAVNFFQLNGGATGGSASISSQGVDANVNIGYSAKGTGYHFFSTGGGLQFSISPSASVVNRLEVKGAATGVAPELSAQGSDANINLKLTTKGTGVLQFGTYTAGVVAQAGYITITDAGGTSRRLLVG